MVVSFLILQFCEIVKLWWKPLKSSYYPMCMSLGSIRIWCQLRTINIKLLFKGFLDCQLLMSVVQYTVYTCYYFLQLDKQLWWLNHTLTCHVCTNCTVVHIYSGVKFCLGHSSLYVTQFFYEIRLSSDCFLFCKFQLESV